MWSLGVTAAKLVLGTIYHVNNEYDAESHQRSTGTIPRLLGGPRKFFPLLFKNGTQLFVHWRIKTPKVPPSEAPPSERTVYVKEP